MDPGILGKPSQDCHFILEQSKRLNAVIGPTKFFLIQVNAIVVSHLPNYTISFYSMLQVVTCE
jgi:hypothetical protein